MSAALVLKPDASFEASGDEPLTKDTSALQGWHFEFKPHTPRQQPMPLSRFPPSPFWTRCAYPPSSLRLHQTPDGTDYRADVKRRPSAKSAKADRGAQINSPAHLTLCI